MALAAMAEPEEQLASTELEAVAELQVFVFPGVLAVVQAPMEEETRQSDNREVVMVIKGTQPLAEEVEEALELAIPGYAHSVKQAAREALLPEALAEMEVVILAVIRERMFSRVLPGPEEGVEQDVIIFL